MGPVWNLISGESLTVIDKSRRYTGGGRGGETAGQRRGLSAVRPRFRRGPT
jgi:hypothetical protein